MGHFDGTNVWEESDRAARNTKDLILFLYNLREKQTKLEERIKALERRNEEKAETS